jgi:hypothetical protein
LITSFVSISILNKIPGI